MDTEPIRIEPLYLKQEGNKLYRSNKPKAGYKLHPAFKHSRTVHRAVGIRLAPDTDKPQWIDEDGDVVNVDFGKQRPWCDIKEDEDRIFVPPFYIRMEYFPLVMWISYFPLKGFKLLPLFKHPDSKSGIWMKKDLGSGRPFMGKPTLTTREYTAYQAVECLKYIERKIW